MKYKIFLGVILTLILAGCASQPERVPDVQDNYVLTDDFYYEVRMSNNMPYEDFIYSINDRVEYNDFLDEKYIFFSTKYRLWKIYKKSTVNNDNLATHSFELNWGYEKGKSENIFKIYAKGDRNYIEGLGFGFNDSDAEINRFYFKETEDVARKILESLDGISYEKQGYKNFSGTLTVKNSDVTAFANIQRLYPSSYVSTNNKNDSKKTGSFVVKPYDIKVRFKIYPYNNRSKVDYSFDVPATYTYSSYYIKKENGFYETKGKKDPHVDYDKSIEKKVLNSVIQSLND